jgi:carbamoyltransferase
VWLQPAAGEAGTALGGALQAAADLGESVEPMPGADLGRSWDEDELADALDTAHIGYECPVDLTAEVARVLSEGALVGWFQGRSEYGPAALGRRSLLADPSRGENLDRIGRARGEREFCPVTALVAAEHAPDIFSGGPLPCPYPLFDHHVAPRWRARLPAVVRADGRTRAQTVRAGDDPLTWRLIRDFGSRTGLPVLVHTELRRAGSPRADSPRDALECFGSAPVDVLVLGPYLVRRRRE